MKIPRRTVLSILACLTIWGALAWLLPSKWRVPTTTKVTGGKDG